MMSTRMIFPSRVHFRKKKKKKEFTSLDHFTPGCAFNLGPHSGPGEEDKLLLTAKILTLNVFSNTINKVLLQATIGQSNPSYLY